jgi:pimeloyl-ACP methyl ester carboxylesterase
MKLFFRQSGQGAPLIILHGLFGSSDNWYSLAKTFAAHYTVYLVDQRNHGQSPHSDEFNYKLLTEDLEEFVRDHDLKDPIILGHSMGGKTAMNFAVKNPALLSKLIVVDIVPKYYKVHHDVLIRGMKAIPLDSIQSRNDAEKILTEFEPDMSVRQFLLKNLSRDESGFHWKINLPAIDTHLDEIGAGMQYTGQFDKPSLFIKGAQSRYYKPGDEEDIQKIFTHAEFVTLDTGHWVQAEKPVEFADTVLNFLGH